MGIYTRFPPNPGFPAKAVEDCIRDALEQELGAQTVLRPRIPSACEPEIDSLVVIEIICAIEEIVGVSLPSTFVPRGGYDHVEACVADLLAQTRAVWIALVKKEEHHDR